MDTKRLEREIAARNAEQQGEISKTESTVANSFTQQ
jgi:hypothetical protein